MYRSPDPFFLFNKLCNQRQKEWSGILKMRQNSHKTKIIRSAPDTLCFFYYGTTIMPFTPPLFLKEHLINVYNWPEKTVKKVSFKPTLNKLRSIYLTVKTQNNLYESKQSRKPVNYKELDGGGESGKWSSQI